MYRLAALVILVACGSGDKAADRAPLAETPAKAAPAPAVGPAVDPVGFDRKCTAATDCVVVKRAGCDPCGCSDDAIASKDMSRFDDASRKLACDPPDLKRKCAPCAPRIAACESGTCVARPRP